MASPMRAVAATLIARPLAVALPVAMVKRAQSLNFATMALPMRVVAAMRIVQPRERVPSVVMAKRAQNLSSATTAIPTLVVAAMPTVRPPAPQQSVATVRSVRSWSSVMMAIPMRATAVMGIVRGPTMSAVTGSWNAPRPVMMAMPWMMAMAALQHVSVREAAAMGSCSHSLRSVTMALPMPAVPATRTAPERVQVQPAATVRHVLNWNSATMASPMLVVPATLIVARPEVALPVVTAVFVRN